MPGWTRSCWPTRSATPIRRRSRRWCAPPARRSVRSLYGLHLHDTCGLGIANALAGLEEGIRAFDSCLAGLGGCPYAPGASGNVVTEDLVFMLESMDFRTGIDIPKLFEARRLLHEGLPAEPLHGQLPKAGIPPTFRKAA